MTDIYLDSFVDLALNVSNDKLTDPESIWLLGRRVALSDVQTETRKLVWVTYRCNFPQIGNSSKTNDAGWGCMLRTAQMMIATGLLKHYNRIHKAGNNEMGSDIYRSIILWFGDAPDYVYSIHNLVEEGGRMGKRYGEWFGPSSVCQALTYSIP